MLCICVHPAVSCGSLASDVDYRTDHVSRTDIEQEANGLYSFDRKEKLDSTRVKALLEEAAQLYYSQAK